MGKRDGSIFESMHRREFMSTLSCAVVAGGLAMAGLSGAGEGRPKARPWKVHEPAADAGTQALVDRVMRAAASGIAADGDDPVVAWTIPQESLASAQSVGQAIREAGRRAVTDFPHSERSPLVRARQGNRVADLKVLLKLNLCGHDADLDMDYKNVHPAFVEGMVDALVEAGVRAENISLADGARYGHVNVMVPMLDVAGILSLVGRRGLVFEDLNAYEKLLTPASTRLLEAAKVPAERYRTSLEWIRMLPSAAATGEMPHGRAYQDMAAVGGAPLLPLTYVRHLDEGWVIDVPKLKVHRLAITSGPVKNLMGVVGFLFPDTTAPHMEKAWIHEIFRFKQDRRQYLAALQQAAVRLADLYLAARPHFSVVEGVLSAGGDGLSVVCPVRAPLVIASENAVYADIAEAEAAGYVDEPSLVKALGLAMPAIAGTAFRRYYPGRSWKSVRRVVDGKPAARIGTAPGPYYCLLAYHSATSAPSAPDSTAFGRPPAAGGEHKVDVRHLRTPFPRLIPSVVKAEKCRVKAAPADNAPVLFWLQRNESVFVRGTDKIRCRWVNGALTCASPTTGETLHQDAVWLLVDVTGDGTRTGWVQGAWLELKR